MHENWTAALSGDNGAYAAKHLKLAFEEFEYGFVYKRVREGQDESDRSGPSAASTCGRTASISATISSGACRSTTRTR